MTYTKAVIEYNLYTGEFKWIPFPENSSVCLDFPADTAIHEIESADHLTRPSTKKTLVLTTEDDYDFVVTDKSYAYVTEGRMTADGEVQAVIFGAYISADEEVKFYEWATENTEAMLENFRSLH
jgi:hypothetical protein